MSAPIALQLYSIREDLSLDFARAAARVAQMGYSAVETGQFAGDPAQQLKVFGDLGLQIVAAHVKAPVGEATNESLEFMEALGIDRLVVPWLDPEIYFQSEDGVRRAADLLNEAATNCAARGLSLLYHNHDAEFGRIGDRLAFDLLLETLDPGVRFEIDTYWVQTAGSDAAQVVRDLGSRAPLLHIKDGPLDREEPMVAVGDGAMDIEAVLAAGTPNTEWLIVELDRCATDMMTAVAHSLSYMTAITQRL